MVQDQKNKNTLMKSIKDFMEEHLGILVEIKTVQTIRKNISLIKIENLKQNLKVHKKKTVRENRSEWDTKQLQLTVKCISGMRREDN